MTERQLPRVRRAPPPDDPVIVARGDDLELATVRHQATDAMPAEIVDLVVDTNTMDDSGRAASPSPSGGIARG